MAAMVASPVVVDLFDRTSTIDRGSRARRGAKSRSISAIRHERAAGERSDSDIDEKKFSHRVLLVHSLRRQARRNPRLTASPDANARRKQTFREHLRFKNQFRCVRFG
jgi:hypothetical protein